MAKKSRARNRHLTRDQRLQILEQLVAGATTEEAARANCCSVRSVFRVLDRFGGMPPRRRRRAPLRLSLREREQIRVGLATGGSLRAIARELGRAPSTIAREVQANGGRRRYRAIDAAQRALALTPRPKPGKLALCPALRRKLERGLARRWSPQQISARLRIEHPHDPSMRVSHETIYRCLYVQSRGELRRQLARTLRSGRTRRRARQTRAQAPKIKDLVSISQRPAEVADRAVPGHWEGDLLVGAGGRSFVATLVERPATCCWRGSDRSATRPTWSTR
jgi:IS30 family transposase